MESVLKNVYINKIQIPKFQGHMRLELRGCRETAVIEHDNHMTAALERMLSAGFLWVDMPELLKALSPTYQKAFGALQLTDIAIPSDAVTIPGGIEVTACASYQVTNNDTALTMGTYNMKESVDDLQSQKITYVYDWATNQGNGTIAAAALTHQSAGYCGYGDAGLQISSGDKDSYLTGSSISVYSPRNTDICLVTDEYEYAIATKDDSIEILRFTSNKKTVDALALSPYEYTNQIDYLKHERFTLDKKADLYISRKYTDGVNIYFLNSDTIYNEQNGICTIINTSNMSIHTVTFKNTTGNSINVNRGFECFDDKLYMVNESGNVLFEVNLENATDIRQYSLPKDDYYLNKAINMHNGKIILSKPGYAVLVFDSVSKSLKPSKLRNSNLNNIINANEIYCIKASNGSYNTTCMYEYISSLYLATINNLDKVVEKTADKTMKVTYTIQQE